MRRHRLPSLLAAYGIAAAAHAQPNDLALPKEYPYRPAFISTISAPLGHTELVVFPIIGKSFRIPIRTASQPLAFSPDGKALFGPCTPEPAGADEPIQIGRCRIDLMTGSTTVVAGSLHPFRDDVANFKRDFFDRVLGSTPQMANQRRYSCSILRSTPGSTLAWLRMV